MLGSPGVFKARKKDPEKMLADFDLYVKAVKNLMILTDNAEATDAKKKALMQSVGGADMIWLWDFMGKVEEQDTYLQAIEKIRAAITGQTNQAMMKYKLFTGMEQEDQAFSSWWSSVKEQADKCNFTGYNQEKAARDAILFQTSNVKLRKRILAEDQSLEEVVKLGLAYEQSTSRPRLWGRVKVRKVVFTGWKKRWLGYSQRRKTSLSRIGRTQRNKSVKHVQMVKDMKERNVLEKSLRSVMTVKNPDISRVHRCAKERRRKRKPKL